MKLHIRLWHGADPKIVAKLDALTKVKTTDTGWSPVWELEEDLTFFSYAWGEKFLAFPVKQHPNEKNEPIHEWDIYVTQHGSFGQR